MLVNLVWATRTSRHSLSALPSSRRLCNRTRACSQQLHDSTARSHGAGPSTTLTHLRPAHAFKPRWQGPPLSLGQRRALIFRAPDLAQVQYRFLSRSSSCPLPLPRPTAHGPRPSDPPFAPTGTGLRQKIWVPSAHWHPYPLLAAQALSIAPDSKSRPCVDWCSAPDDRLTRRQAPRIRGTRLGGPNTHPSSFPQGVSKRKR